VAGRTLTGATALVTGASSGIGRAVALGLAARGSHVWLVGRRADALEEAAAEAASSPGQVRALPADITNDDDLADVRLAIDSDGARLDAVVHSAGTIAFGALEDAPVADLDAQYRANLRGPYVLTQALLPLLRQGGGDVVFVNSTACLGPRPGAGQFAATQAALRAVADSLREEINGEGVRVMTMFPGRTATPRQERIHAFEGKDYRPDMLMQPEDIAAMVVAALQLPRTAEVMEIAMRPFARPA
jgi:NADP-dependent 3-hydroxy acid dehydrogenase YdfG